MLTTRKKSLAVMQKGIISYKLIKLDWDISDHFGDGYDLFGEKDNKIIKIELKAIDLSAIQTKSKYATQSITANEIANSTHLIISVFEEIKYHSSYIMSIKQFVENSGSKKYKQYIDYFEFIAEYKKLAKSQMARRKNEKSKKVRLNFDISFNPEKINNWKLYPFKNIWNNLES